jgi:hypothetical protein
METAPIILFTYNRLKHTRATVKALLENKLVKNSELIVFSDAPFNEAQIKRVSEVREFIKTIDAFKKIEIIERGKNYGLGENIIDGVTKVINQYGKAIILEDDLITSPYFLQFMNDALRVYEGNDKVISVHGYVYPVKKQLPETFFLRGADCLGWATWKRGWGIFERDGQVLLNKLVEKNLVKEFDYNNAYPYTQMLKDQIQGKNSSWAVRWYASAFVNDLYTLNPGRSLVYHAGGDGSGINAGFDQLLNVNLSDIPIKVIPIIVKENALAYNEYVKFHRKIAHPPLLYRIKRALKRINFTFNKN